MVTTIRDLGYPGLGPAFIGLSGDTLHSALVAHRLTAKFSRPVESDRQRSNISIQNTILQDNAGVTGSISDFWNGLDTPTRLDLIRAKGEIQRLLVGFKLPQVATRFPSGESVVSTAGEISFAAKFSLDSQWTCGAGSMRYAARLCWNTPPLKKMVKERCEKLYPLRFFDDGVGGFENFFRRFRAVVDIDTARLSTVPKDALWDRVISMEPTFSMIAQLQLSLGLRKCLEEVWGYKLEERDALHGTLISIPGLATIDLKNASNSNWHTIVRALWPPHVYKHLKAFRSDTVMYKDGNGQDAYWSPNMLSPMGNGFTFEVMTITLLAMVKCCDPDGSVYGDDIICKEDAVPRLYRMLSATGWSINHQKTFIEGNFRESCGQFYATADKQYLLSYDLWYPIDDMDVCVAANKLYLLLQKQTLDAPLRRSLLKAYVELLKLYAAFSRPAESEPIGGGIFSPFFTGLMVNKKHEEMFQALYQRRPVWRLEFVVKDFTSEVVPHEWVCVASRLLNGSQVTLKRTERRYYAKLVDDLSGQSHEECSRLFLSKLTGT